MFGLDEGETGRFIHQQINLQTVGKSMHLTKYLTDFNEPGDFDYVSIKAVLMKLINIQNGANKKALHSMQPLDELVSYTNAVPCELEKRIPSNERSSLMQELNGHPHQLKWIASIKRLDDLSILTGRTKLRKELMDAKFQFDLCLIKTPPNDNARSTLTLIRELVCCIVDSKHWVNHIKA